MCTSPEEVMPTNSIPTKHTCGMPQQESPNTEHKCVCQRLLPWRRWHASLGLLLIAFLIVHLSTCVTIYRPALYQAHVNRLHQIIGGASWLFIAALFTILAIQFVTGGYLLYRHGLSYRVTSCNRGGKLRFFLQRNSALLVGFFLLFHIGTLCRWGLHAVYRFTHSSLLSRYAEHGLFNPSQAFLSTVHGLKQAWSTGSPQSFGNRTCFVLILVGILAAAYHVTNGLLSGGYVLNISKNPSLKRIWMVLSLLIGALILACGVVAWCVLAYSA